MEAHDGKGSNALSVLKCQVSIRKTKLERFRMLFVVVSSPTAVVSFQSVPLSEEKSDDDISVTLDTVSFISSVAERAAEPSGLVPGTPSAILYGRVLDLLRRTVTPELLRQCSEAPSGDKKMEAAISAAIDSELALRSIVYVAFDTRDTETLQSYLSGRASARTKEPVPAAHSGEEHHVEPENPLSDAISVVHNCTAVIDPVEGKNASRLGKGDVVEVRLPKESGIYEMIAKNRTDFDGLVAGHIESVSRAGKGYSLIFTIAEGLKGMTELDGNYKIRLLYDGYVPDASARSRRDLWLAPTVVLLSLVALAAVVLYVMTH